MNARIAAGQGARQAHLVLIEKSGAKHRIPQPSTAKAMVEAEHAMHGPGQLREVKVIIRHTAVARWKADEHGWRRVAQPPRAVYSQSRRRKMT